MIELTSFQLWSIGGFLGLLYLRERLLSFIWLFITVMGILPEEHLGYTYFAIFMLIVAGKFFKGR